MKENKEESEMTPVYEVRTKHTEQVLKDFISFKEAERVLPPKSGSKPIYLYKRKESTCTAGAFFIVKCYFL